MSSALCGLMVVSERYPDLKSNQNFLPCNRSSRAPRTGSPWHAATIWPVQSYNTEIRTFPGRIWHSVMYSDMPIRETFAANAGAEKAPAVKF